LHGAERTRALFEAALEAQHGGDWIRAESLYRQALALDPDRAPVLANLSALLVGLKRHAEARECCQRLAALQPANAAAHLNLGHCHMYLAAPADALACYERALVLDPGSVEAVYGRGNALLDLGRLPDARDCYRQLIADRPDFSRTLHDRGLVLLDQGKAEAALICCATALGVETPPGKMTILARVSRDPRQCFEAESLPAAAEARLALEPMVLDWSPGPVAWATRTRTPPRLARLPRGSVLGQSFVPVTEDRKTCLDWFAFNPAQPDKVRLFEDAAAIPVTGPRSLIAHLEGPDDYDAGVLLGSHPNFGHWLLNHLARLALAESAPALEGVPLVVGDNITARQLECLELMGYGETRLLRLRKGRLARFDRLWAPMMPLCGIDGTLHWAPAIVDFLRQRLGVRDDAPPGARRRLYLTRRGARWRRVLNEDTLSATLADRGFETVDPGTLTIRQQRELAANAEAIVGAFGAGMNLLLFAPRDATVVELKPAARNNMNINPALARRIGQRYGEIIGTTPTLAGDLPAHDQDFVVEAARLMEVLDALGF